MNDINFFCSQQIMVTLYESLVLEKLDSEIPGVTENRIAEIIVKTLNIKKCIARGDTKCYIFQEHSWKILDKISFFNFITEVTGELNDYGFENRTLLNLFKKANFCNNVYREMVNIMDVIVFDENPFLICCKNGVLDLEKGIFRDGKPTDYCYKTTGYDYKEPSDNEINLLECMISKTFPNKDMRNQFIDTFTHFLVKYPRYDNYSQNRCIFNSSRVMGNSGVSTIRLLMKLTFGDYTLPTSPNNSKFTSHRFVLLCHQSCLSPGSVKHVLSNSSSPVWFDETSIYDEIRHTHQFRHHKKLNILNFESSFLSSELLCNETYMNTEFYKNQLDRGLVFERCCYKNDDIAELAPVMMWKLFQNHIAKIRELLVYHLNTFNGCIHTFDNNNLCLDIFTNTFDFNITKCGCAKCVDYFSKTLWSTSNVSLIYLLEDIDQDVKFTIANIFVRL